MNSKTVPNGTVPNGTVPNGTVWQRAKIVQKGTDPNCIILDMIYKFDILLKKSLRSGGLKVVTYSSLLENPEIFGEGEGLADAEGELSMVLEGPEEGFSINALYRKYRAQLVGRRNAELLGKDFPLRFVFARADGSDVSFTEVA